VAERRVIAHLDMDAFYVSVELLRHPELRGKPLIIAWNGPRSVVTTASYEARKFGVGSAMPASRARRLCPQGIYLPPDMSHYRDVSRKVMALIDELGVTTEQVSLDELYLDLSTLEFPVQTMTDLVRRIRDEMGLDASVGIGPNKLVAKVASDAEKPRGFVCLTREQACARFGSRPPGLVPGIGPKTVQRLERMGIATLARLAAAPLEALVAEFGSNHGPDLQRRARFEGSAAITPVRIAVSESRETTFDTDIADPARLEELLVDLATQLCERLAAQERRGRTIAIKVRLDDFATITRARTIAAPTNDPATVVGVAVALLREYAPARPVRLLGVRVASFDHGDAGAPTDEQLALPL
jgi:DNA polymerase IV